VAFLESAQSKAFLGEEFLTWLLWRSETRSGLVGVGETEVHFGGGLALTAPFGDAEEVALKGDTPGAAPEMFAALSEGKLVARAQMRWIIEGVEWHVAVRGATLDFSGLRPPLRSAPPDAAWIERRLELLESFARGFDQAFEAFLALRLGDRAWAKETAEMRAWAAQGAGDRARREPPEIIEVTDPES
jgi:hypothetical protein